MSLHTTMVILGCYGTCLLDNYGIIQTSTSMASGRKGDTLIRFEIQGGFVRFSYKKSPHNSLWHSLTFNQGVTGSRPVRPTKAGRPSLPGSFWKNQGVKTLGQPTPWFYFFCRKISNYILYYERYVVLLLPPCMSAAGATITTHWLSVTLHC